MAERQPRASKRLDVVVVGPGRLGRSVARLLTDAGHRVRLVGRGQPVPAAPLTWLTVPDRAIAEVAGRVPRGGVVLHASGATDLSPLSSHLHPGSLHPLMTFPGPEVALPDLTGVPAAIAGDPVAIAAAADLARALGLHPVAVPGDRRLYHAAAVMAGNFTTALLAEAARALVAAGVPEQQAPAMLAPLAIQAIRNVARHGPAQALTGPVARGDEAVLAAHRAALASDPELLATYDALLALARRLAGGR